MRPSTSLRSNEDEAVVIKKPDLGSVRPQNDKGLLPKRPSGADMASSGNIDDMIKRLANDIEAGRKNLTVQPALDAASAPPPLPEFVEPSFDKLFPEPAQVSNVTDAAYPGGAKHPRSLPPTMMDAARMPPPAPLSTAPTSSTAKLAAIADALSDEQLDVFLETINALDDFRARHYEVSVRIRLPGGDALDNATFISATRGTGLLPLLEAVKVSSTKRLAVQMIRRGRSGEFFANVDGEALSEAQFGTDVETITGGDQALAARLVLGFSQADIRGLTQAQLRTMDAIAALGFRFSVEAITDLDMDFEALAARGFKFAKLDAEVFLGGLPIGVHRVPSKDLCQHLEKSGLTVIVGSISDDEQRTAIAALGATLGQGSLFGVPRPVRADVLRPPTEHRPSAG